MVARPGLGLPIYSPGTGELAGYQLRPDQPRMDKDGKIVKYETKRGARAMPDVHPRMFSKLQDVSVPLYVTEGIKKGDAAASKGLCCLALTGGVWGLQTKGGIHPELTLIKLQGRRVYIVFDSDIATNVHVKLAAERSAKILRAAGASVQFIVLSPGSAGEKVGLDDFFVAGRSW